MMPFFMPFLLAMVITIALLPIFGRFAARWRVRYSAIHG